ncbi:MAG: hypothetical protein ACYTF6_08755 [Planctomycetota bacterium]
MFKKQLRGPIWALIGLSAGGLLLHIRIHPPTESLFNWLPAISGAVTLLVLPVMFNYRRTVAWAYMLNVAAVVVGAAIMAWYSATHWQGPVTWDAVLLKSTLADILILAAKLPLGHHILRHFRGGAAAKT